MYWLVVQKFVTVQIIGDMVEQYPHFLFVINGGESMQDEDGNWTQQEETIEFVSKCREETNGKGSQIQVAGGKFHVFASLIQLPKSTLLIGDGTTVFVTNDEAGKSVRVKGDSLKYDVGQLHLRLWV